ncbi:MAG: VWA domain-containing protein [Rhodospirillaceae bacterium]|mgnify:CR=1 FL=1|jgi:hypothetical protein|nr:VWA domain-containing protein [Rhodospirillaceae bacterium]
MSKSPKVPDKQSRDSVASVDAFLQKAAAIPRGKAPGSGGRLLFALDATASRQPTWDHAAHIQAEMFQAASALGGLDIQLVFFRGFGEFKVSPWTGNGPELLRLMTSVTCLAGTTQVGKVLKHARNEQKRRKIDALVYVGDCFEEDIDAVGTVAGELGLLGVPCFMFHEGADPIATFAFQQISKLSGGAYFRFDASSAATLKELLRAVAVYASGGFMALKDHSQHQGGDVRQLTDQLARHRGG